MNKSLFDFNLAPYLPKFNMELGGEPMNGKWAEKIAIQNKLQNNADLRTALEVILLEVVRVAKGGGFECKFPIADLTYTIKKKGKKQEAELRRTIPLSVDDWRFIARCLEKCHLHTEQRVVIDPVSKKQQNDLFVYW